jgi:hypothetical protein
MLGAFKKQTVIQAQSLKISELLQRTKDERNGFVSLTKQELEDIKRIQDKQKLMLSPPRPLNLLAKEPLSLKESL